jgi:aryl-alcohol dehydrogenase-like predicted oxidoreductase
LETVLKQRLFDENTQISEVGLGCWQLGGLCWGDLDEERAFEIMQASVDQGVTFFDTADVYGEGRSETLIGSFLKKHPHDIFVATKLGRFAQPGWPYNFSRKTMTQHTEASLARLGVEALDLTQLHCIPTKVMQQGEVFDTLRGLKAAGKIKAFGASVESMDEALICLEQDGLASLQVIFNIFRQKPIRSLFAKAKDKGVAIIARVPLASGLLTGKLSVDTDFAENDHRRFNKDGECFNVGETFAGLPFAKGVALAEQIKTLVPAELSMAQMALRWILDHEAVSVVIPGASKAEQARANAAASELTPLAPELHAQLASLYKTEVTAHIRGPY